MTDTWWTLTDHVRDWFPIELIPLSLVAVPYLTRLCRTFARSLREHAQESFDRPAWLHVLMGVLREVASLLTNTRYTVMFHDHYVAKRFRDKSLSDRAIAAHGAVDVCASIARAPFTIVFTALMLAMTAVIPATILNFGAAALAVHLWLLFSIGLLGHRIANPLNTAAPWPLAWASANSSAALVITAMYLKMTEELPEVLLLVAAFGFGSVSYYVYQSLAARNRTSIVGARKKLAAVMRANYWVGMVLVAPFHVVMSFSPQRAPLTRWSLVGFTAINVTGLLLGLRRRRRLLAVPA